MAPPRPRFRPGRRRQAGALSIALGVGLLAFAFLEPDGTPVRNPTPSAPPSSTAPTVLGVTVEPEPTLPTAGAASPVTFELDADASPTTGPRATPTTRSPGTSTPTTEGPVLIPPTVVTNTTTSETTTTTEGSTTTSETPTTTPTDGSGG